MNYKLKPTIHATNILNKLRKPEKLNVISQVKTQYEIFYYPIPSIFPILKKLNRTFFLKKMLHKIVYRYI